MNSKKILMGAFLASSLVLTGCSSSLISNNSYSEIEKVALTVIDSDELIRIKEIPVSNTKDKKDLEIYLNLNNATKTILYDMAINTSANIMRALEPVFEDELNDYKFIINEVDLDVYGNEQKSKVLELIVPEEEVSKINFENFRNSNLDKISKVTKFGSLKEEKVHNVNVSDVKTKNNSEKKEDNSNKSKVEEVSKKVNNNDSTKSSSDDSSKDTKSNIQ